MDEVRDFLQSKNSPNLLLIVNPSPNQLFSVSDHLLEERNFYILSVNSKLSKFLITRPEKDYSSIVLSWLVSETTKLSGKPIIIKDIELLFEPTFHLDPLVIFNNLSRNHKIFVFWPGNYTNKHLSYATPDHAHYRTWADPRGKIITIPTP